MEETRRQRELLEWDLGSRSNSSRSSGRDGTSEGGLDRGEAGRLLKQQIGELSLRIRELEEGRQEMNLPPPDYFSALQG
jgi:hypothetical protein